jgi:hypothetical protein
MNENNRRRWRAVLISRDWKALLPSMSAPAWLRTIAALLTAIVGRRWAYRTAFTGDDGAMRIATQHVLADLREYSFARTSAFDPDPIIMARRQGRRDVWLRISNYLNLDEAQVQTLMEIDDGI